MEVAHPRYLLLSTFHLLPFLLASVLLKNTGSSTGRFDYEVPPPLRSSIGQGDLVAVPFRDKTVHGIVWETAPEDGARQVKAIVSLERKDILRPFQIALSEWVSDYYYAPLAKVVEGMVPEKLWSGSFRTAAHRSQTISPGQDLPRGKRQTEVWHAVKEAGSARFDDLKKAVPWLGKAFLKRMLEANILTGTAGRLPAPYFKAANNAPAHRAQPIARTPSQQAALERITSDGSAKPYLLFGPPASGKTEVYLELAKRSGAAGKQALILVPEIALTTQLIEYFVRAFGDRIAVLHSQLSDTERCIEWERLRTGEAQIAIGSRIALFAPFLDLDCICVDEEHEWTYKSEQTPRYHARDVAIKLGELTQSTVILGSATPSIESFTYAKVGKYELVRLERIVAPVEKRLIASLQTPPTVSLEPPLKFQNKYRIRSARLKGWDYSSDGAYFITICTKNREHFFGEIVNGEMRLSPIGKIVADEWKNTVTIRPEIEMDEWVVMPNHIHGIIIIHDPAFPVETHSYASLRIPQRNTFGPQSRNISAIVRGFKGATTKNIHLARYTDFAWQPRFYDHLIRDETSLHQIREYIRDNPKNWDKDKENEEGLKM